MERHCQNAMALARWLADHPAVEQVIYPGLPAHPQHELAKRQMRGFGGMVSLVLKGGESAARRMIKRTKLFTLAVSLGGVESLVELPIGMTHASSAESEIAVNPALVRLSVGIEHIDDLLTDLDTALAG
jgi:cystathionine beta-lyase/cystathionine gamma-synthase